MSIVQRIQNLCISKDLTLIGLEREIGLGRGTIRNWDKNSPSSDKLLKVANYFNVSIDYLLGRRSSKNQGSTILLRAEKELPDEAFKKLEDMAEFFLDMNKRNK